MGKEDGLKGRSCWRWFLGEEGEVVVEELGHDGRACRETVPRFP